MSRVIEVIIEDTKHDDVPDPILGLGTKFGDSVFLVHFPKIGKWGAYNYSHPKVGKDLKCLACFSQKENAMLFAKEKFGSILSDSPAIFPEIPFDDAREIAKEHPAQLDGMILLDVNPPEVHFVR